jgi:hypothetical protein
MHNKHLRIGPGTLRTQRLGTPPASCEAAKETVKGKDV